MTRSSTRAEIQALRAFAVLAVVLNHLWPGRLSGGFLGVDVFFVISGFLITAHLWREVDATGRVRFGAFWLRRARRLLPASLLVAGAVLVGAVALLPATAWSRVFGEVVASVLYVENWTLVASSADYFQAGAAATPMQHYWSLSVEEQFYLVWPLLVVLGALLAVRSTRFGGRRRTIAAVLGVVVIASLVASVVMTATDPAQAYFNTAARAWEFGAGGLLALAAHRISWGRRVRVVVAVVGWLALLVSVVVFDGSMGFPGFLALVPVVATMLVVAAGDALEPRGRIGAMAVRPVVWLGDVSYSVYLWHWPLIIFAGALGVAGSLPSGLAILVVTLALSALSRRFVEDPVRRSQYLQNGPRRRHLVLAGATALVVVGAGFGSVAVEGAAGRAQASALGQLGDDCFGAAATAPGSGCQEPHRLASTDAALAAQRDVRARVTNGEVCQQDREVAAVEVCAFGAEADDSVATIALVGDSHAGHWISALDKIAEDRSWRVEEYLKSSCPAVIEPTVHATWYPAGAASCREWSAEVVAGIAADPAIDVVVVSSISREYAQTGADGGPVPLTAGAYLATWQVWLDAGKRVVVLADPPQWGLGDVPTCVVRAGVDDPCTVSATARERDPMVAAARGVPGVTLVDLNDFLCDGELCHPVVGGLVAIGDGSHLTRTFSLTLAPPLAQALIPVVEE